MRRGRREKGSKLPSFQKEDEADAGQGPGISMLGLEIQGAADHEFGFEPWRPGSTAVMCACALHKQMKAVSSRSSVAK